MAKLAGAAKVIIWQSWEDAAVKAGLPNAGAAVTWRILAAQRGQTSAREILGLAGVPEFVLWECLWRVQTATGWPCGVDLTWSQ